MKSRPLVALAVLASTWCACTEDAAPAAGSCRDVELIVAASNYESSYICGAPTCDAKTGLDLGRDPRLASTNRRIFFVAQDKDLIFELDPACGTAKQGGRFSVDAFARVDPVTGLRRNANPHDVAAAADGTLIVPLYAAAKIVFVNDGVVTSTIDLAGPEYDADGNPQADAIRVVDVRGVPKAFVTLERLDDDDPMLRSKQPSQMLQIDVASRKVDGVIELAGRNPFNAMAELGTALYMAEPGLFEDANEDRAGIERFDTATSTTKMLVREGDLGGSVVEVAVTDGCGAAIVAGPEQANPTSLVTFDPVTGRVFSTQSAPVLGPTTGYDLQGLAWRGRSLYVGDRRRGPTGFAVHVFEDRGGCSLASTGRTLELPYEPVALRSAR